jgi:tetratricopeptide (TPR) repeat protein
MGGDGRKKALLARAAALAEAGRFDEARTDLRRVIELYENAGDAWAALANLTKFEAGDPAFAAMETSLAKGAAQGADETLALRFALGKAYLDVGDSRRAFAHLNAGNRLKRAQLAYNAEANSSRMAAIAAAFPAEIFARFAEAGSRAAAPIFVVGMPRSGTTLIEQILASHPAIHGAGELPILPRIAVEIGGMPEGVAALTAERLAQLGEAYVERVGAPPAGKSRWVDKFTGNFAYAGLIRLILPEARIIHSRRDPVDACLSCYAAYFNSPALAFAYDMTELGRYCRDYLALMAHWRAVLPETRFLEIDYEAVVDDLETEARRMIAFLGLPWDPACLDFHLTRRPVRTASVSQVRRPIYSSSVGRWRAHAAELAPLLEALGVAEP